MGRQLWILGKEANNGYLEGIGDEKSVEIACEVSFEGALAESIHPPGAVALRSKNAWSDAG